MPREFTPEELGLTQEQYDYVPEAPSKVDVLTNARDSKLDTLSRKVPKSTNELRDEPFGQVGGQDYLLKNKLFNDLTDTDAMAITGQTIADKQLIQDNGTFYRQEADGTRSEYTGDVGQLYLLAGKEDDSVQKLGFAGDKSYGGMPAGYESRYAKGTGPLGADATAEGEQMSIWLPKDDAYTLENMWHGREGTLDNRLALLNTPEFKEAQTLYGGASKGTTEYYKGGNEGIFGTSDVKQERTPDEYRAMFEGFRQELYPGLEAAKFEQAPTEAGYGVDDWMKALVQVESGGDANAVSPKGAFGLTQLMPGTAKDPGFGIEPMRENTPEEQMRVGTEYFVALNEKYGNADDALRAYNWGTGNVDKWIAAGRPEDAVPQETKDYVGKVKGNLPQGVAQAEGALPSGERDLAYYQELLDTVSAADREQQLANMTSFGRGLEEAQQAISGGVAGIGQGVMDIVDAGQELATYPAQLLYNTVMDENVDIDLFNDKTKKSMVEGLQDIVGYDATLDEASVKKAEKLIEASGAEFMSPSTWKKLLTTEEGRGAILEYLKNPSMTVNSLTQIVGAGGALGAATKVGGKIGAKIAPQLAEKVGKLLNTNRATLSKELTIAKTLPAAEQKAAIKALEDSYTLSKRIPDLFKGSVYTNADLMVRMNEDITQYIENNNGEEPTPQKLMEIFAVNRLLSSAEIGSLKLTAKIKDVAKEELKQGIANAVKKVTGHVVKSTGVEAAQEAFDAIGQQVNQKLDSEKYKDWTVAEILEDASTEIIGSFIAGASMGTHIGLPSAVAGEVKGGALSKAASVMSDRESRLKSGLQTGKETVTAVREDVRDAFGGDSFDNILNSVAPTPEARGEQLDKVNTKRSADNVSQVEQLLQETVGAYNESLGANKTEFDSEIAAAVAVQTVSSLAETSKAQGPEAALKAAEEVSAMLVSLRSAGKAKEADAYSKQLLQLMPDMAKYFGTDKEGFKKYASDVIEAQASTGKGVTKEDLKQIVKALSSIPGMDTKEAKDLISRAAEIGRAYKVMAGAGSDTGTVGADVALGARGFVPYFDGYRQAIAAGDDVGAALYTEKLQSFSSLMADKSANLSNSLEERRAEVNKATLRIPGFNEMTANDKAIALADEFKDEKGKALSFEVDYGTGQVGTFSYAPLIDEVVGRVPTNGLPVTAKNVAKEVKAMQDLLDYANNDLVKSKSKAVEPVVESSEKPVVTEAEDLMANADEWDTDVWMGNDEEFGAVVTEQEEVAVQEPEGKVEVDLSSDADAFNAMMNDLVDEANDAYYRDENTSAWGDINELEPETGTFEDNFEAAKEAKPKQDPLSKARAAGKKRAEEAKAARTKATEDSSKAWESISKEAQNVYKRQFSFRMADVTTEDMLKLIKEDYENYIKVANKELDGKPNVRKIAEADKKAAMDTLTKLNTMENNCG